MDTLTLRAAVPADADAIKALALDNRMFEPDEIGDFDEMLSGYFAGALDGHRWIVAGREDRIVGAAYYAPEPFADRMWNLYFIATATDDQGTGVGSKIVRYVEDALRLAGRDVARTLIVDTSSLEKYERARSFYRNRAFVEEARVRDFYGPDDHKVTFWKSLFSDSLLGEGMS